MNGSSYVLQAKDTFALRTDVVNVKEVLNWRTKRKKLLSDVEDSKVGEFQPTFINAADIWMHL